MKFLVYVPENFTNYKGLVKRLKGEDQYVNEYELATIVQFNEHNGLPLTSSVHIPPVGKFHIDKGQEFILLDDVIIVKASANGFYPLSTDGLKEVLNTFGTYLSDVSPSKKQLRENYLSKLINT